LNEPAVEKLTFVSARMASAILMDTLVTIELAREGSEASRAALERALGWFTEVEDRCSRFEPDSEVMRLCLEPGRKTEVSPLLYAVLDFGLKLAALTEGAFDPATGATLARLGFDTSYKTGRQVQTADDTTAATFRDIVLDPASNSVTLERPLVIDLGALAKGFAMDLAARELADFGGFCIDAGGDILVSGKNGAGEPWTIGIQHPRHVDEVIEVLRIESGAVCTSGDYERRSEDGASHIIDGRAPASPSAVISATVIAPTAMAADGLSTAAFILGPRRGLELLRRAGVEGMLVTYDMRRHQTSGFAGFYA
jgi:thiamine biosynthesis lipoprotein